MEDEPDAEFVGAAFESEGEERLCWWWERAGSTFESLSGHVKRKLVMRMRERRRLERVLFALTAH